MRVLLGEASGPTGRQMATHLAEAEHEVEALTATGFGLANCTRHVRRLHRVPPLGRDPFTWLDAAVAVLREGRFDALLPTHEHVAVLSRAARRVHATRVATALPPFDELCRVQDKIAAYRTLAELGVPQPESRVVHTPRELADAVRVLPVYVKRAVGTASAGVAYVATDRQRSELLASRQLEQPLLVQRPADGDVVMIQAVFAGGDLVAWHANERVHTGVSGGGALKRSTAVPEAEQVLRRLGGALRWHGALSLDAVRSGDGLRYIDVNPRLVEPGNARRAGVDLTAALLDVTLGRPVRASRGTLGTTTHQLLIAMLGVPQAGGSRRRVIAEIGAAATRRGRYAGSVEELTPLRGDPAAVLPPLAVCAALLARPGNWRRFAGSVENYALTDEAWHAIRGARGNS